MENGLKESVVSADVPPYAAVTVVAGAESGEPASAGGIAAPAAGLLVAVILAYVAIMRRPSGTD